MRIKSIFVASLLLTLGVAFSFAPNASASTSDNASSSSSADSSQGGSVLDIALTRTPRGISLSWSDSDEIDYYEIQRFNPYTYDYRAIGTTREDSFLDMTYLEVRNMFVQYKVVAVDESERAPSHYFNSGYASINISDDLQTPWLSDATHFHGNTYLVSHERSVQNNSRSLIPRPLGDNYVSVYLDGKLQQTAKQNFESQTPDGNDEYILFPFEVTVPDDGKSHIVQIDATNRDRDGHLHQSGKSNTLTIPARNSSDNGNQIAKLTPVSQ